MADGTPVWELAFRGEKSEAGPPRKLLRMQGQR